MARYLTRRQLRVLCYHGLSFEDEHEYDPVLFMRPETVRSRFSLLAQRRYPVLSLGEGIAKLYSGMLPPCATVITFDDGFYSNFALGEAILRDFGFPATLYVTTHYVERKLPIFRHVVRYMFWKTQKTELQLDGLPGVRLGVIRLTDRQGAELLMWKIIEHGEAQLSEAERVDVCQELGNRLGIEYPSLAHSRRLSLMTPDEVRQLEERGVDMQLHTHRHSFPLDEGQARREIMDNRAVLEPLVSRACRHFCYPSGVYSSKQWPVLEQLGIESATTCDAGLNDSSTPRYGIKRILDTESVRPIEFEAEISGFAPLVRKAVDRMRGNRNSNQSTNEAAHGR